jgi:hypothetical protein
MPLRKMKQKKFTGIYEYYRASDSDKATTAYYISLNVKVLHIQHITDLLSHVFPKYILNREIQ